MINGMLLEQQDFEGSDSVEHDRTVWPDRFDESYT